MAEDTLGEIEGNKEHAATVGGDCLLENRYWEGNGENLSKHLLRSGPILASRLERGALLFRLRVVVGVLSSLSQLVRLRTWIGYL